MKKISSETKLFKIISDILKYPDDSKEVLVGVESMDDCSLIKISDTESMAITTDFIRGSGFYLFNLGYLNYFDVGYYLISANLSDLASVGARPIGLSTAIRYGKMTNQDFRDVFLGMKESADLHNARIIGGDIGGYDEDVFTATAFGKVITEKAMLRKNVQKDDLLCVTGTVGRAITALTYFKEVKGNGFNLSIEEEEEILASWKRPQARINEGLLLANNRLANACLDVSDGLKASVQQLSMFSSKTFTINSSKVPIHDITKKLANHLQIPPLQIAVSASVDFELMFTISPDDEEKCLELFENEGMKMSVIGKVNDSGKNIMIDENGIEVELPGVAWKQQSSDDYLKKIIKR